MTLESGDCDGGLGTRLRTIILNLNHPYDFTIPDWVKAEVDRVIRTHMSGMPSYMEAQELFNAHREISESVKENILRGVWHSHRGAS
jgi:hypothetical protein